MKKLVIRAICSRAWDLAVKHWLVFVIIQIICSLINHFFTFPNKPDITLMKHPDIQVFLEYIHDLYVLNWPTVIAFSLFSSYIGIVVYRMLVRAVRTGKPYTSLVEAFKVAPLTFVGYICVVITFVTITELGVICCILPGIFLGIRFMFTQLIYATEDVSFSEAFERSWELTRGHFWKLFLLGLTAFGILILGICACCVGLLFALVIVNFMLVLVYLELKGEDQQENVEEAVEVVEP